MLVAPHSHDQPDNAFRAKNLGVGESLPAHKYTAKRVALKLSQVVTHAKRAVEIGEIVRGDNGVGTACDAIEKLLAS